MAAIRAINDPISIEELGAIALVCINNPPVNATGLAVRQGLQQAIEVLNSEGVVQAIGIYAAGEIESCC